MPELSTYLFGEGAPFFHLLEVLLRVRADLHDGSCTHEASDGFPVLTIPSQARNKVLMLLVGPATLVSLDSADVYRMRRAIGQKWRHAVNATHMIVVLINPPEKL